MRRMSSRKKRKEQMPAEPKAVTQSSAHVQESPAPVEHARRAAEPQEGEGVGDNTVTEQTNAMAPAPQEAKNEERLGDKTQHDDRQHHQRRYDRKRNHTGPRGPRSHAPQDAQSPVNQESKAPTEDVAQVQGEQRNEQRKEQQQPQQQQRTTHGPSAQQGQYSQRPAQQAPVQEQAGQKLKRCN